MNIDFESMDNTESIIIEKNNNEIDHTNSNEDNKITKENMDKLNFTSLLKISENIGNISLLNEKKITPIENTRDAIIIGAGIIGCYTAIQLRQRGFKGNIIIYEKQRENRSNHLIKLPSNKDFLSRNQKIENFVDDIEMNHNSSVKISDFENLLNSVLQTLPNIFMNYYEVDDLEALSKIYTNHPIIIHANGNTSNTRNQILKDKLIMKPIFHIIQFSYNVTTHGMKSAEKVGNYDHYKIEKHLSFLTNNIEQIVDESKNKITIRFYVDSFFYDTVKIYNFNHPCNFETLQTDTELIRTKITDSVIFYLKFRIYFKNEIPDLTTFSLLSYKLDCYRSSTFAITQNNLSHFFIGDCAMGVPFYRSLRNGFIESNNFASLLMNLKEDINFVSTVNLNESSILRVNVSKLPVVNNRLVDDYNQFMEEFSEEEFLRARKVISDKGLKDVLIKATSFLPWTINEISTKIKEEIDNLSLSL